MSLWEELNLAEEITQILQEVPDNPGHHFGFPFLSAYQIAIELVQRRPDILSKTTYKVGGAGTGEHTSLAQYLAHQLSIRIKSGELAHIEGGFISNWHLQDILFDYQGKEIRSSLTETQYNLSIYRYKP